MKTRFRLAVLALVVLFAASNARSEVYTWWYIPHLAFGAGYTSYLTIRDPQAIASRQTWVTLYDDNGNELPANVEGAGQQVSNFTFTLQASQEKTFAITGDSSLKVGWVQIACVGLANISASLRFTVTDGSGNATDVVGILPTQSNLDWTVSVEKRSATDYTGIAIVNPYSNPVTFNIDFYQNGSRVPGTTTRTFTLPKSGHMAKFVHEAALFKDAWNNFSGIGTLRISGTSPTGTFCAVALRGDGTQYSSLPADAGVQNWSLSFSGSSGPASWFWQMFDGFHFIGYEQNYEDTNHAGQRVRMRGVLASDLSPSMFVLDWIYSSTDGSVQGMVVFQGVAGKEGSTDVINGTRLDLNKDGTVKGKVTFKATRVF
ncbi:MAG TPA: hypothetical protein VE398_17580 [Acidobacteriota bacterium]|nr:hypothetical protein [Acidobacteriota bacterium]